MKVMVMLERLSDEDLWREAIEHPILGESFALNYDKAKRDLQTAKDRYLRGDAHPMLAEYAMHAYRDAAVLNWLMMQFHENPTLSERVKWARGVLQRDREMVQQLMKQQA